MNFLRTAMLLAALTAIFMGVGYLIGGTGGLVVAFFIAAATNLFSYWNADKLVLSMHHAREVDERSAPQLYGIVRGLAANADLPMPRVYVMDNPQPNAFATGRNPQNAAVAATTSSIGVFDRELRTIGIPAPSAARAVASSPSLCAIRWKAVGAIKIGMEVW